MKIIHTDGVWLVNRSQFPQADTTQGAHFAPGEPTCVHLSEWLKFQMRHGLFEQVESPLKPAVPLAPPTSGRPIVPRQAR